MQTITAGWRRMAFAVAVAGALGFGATQALAAPAPMDAEGRMVCGTCWGRCPQYGGDLVNGRCVCCLP